MQFALEQTHPWMQSYQHSCVQVWHDYRKKLIIATNVIDNKPNNVLLHFCFYRYCKRHN